MYHRKMHTKFMNSINNERSDFHGPLVNITDKIDLSRSDEYVPLSNLILYSTWKNIKK